MVRRPINGSEKLDWFSKRDVTVKSMCAQQIWRIH
jgi:hypothetical protein